MSARTLYGRKFAVFAAILIVFSFSIPCRRGFETPTDRDYFVKGYVYDYHGNGVLNAIVTVKVNGDVKATDVTDLELEGYIGWYKVNVGQDADIYDGAPIEVTVVYQSYTGINETEQVDLDKAFQAVDVTITNLLVALVAPENLTVANQGTDIVLNWDLPNCDFDNYSIYISNGPNSFNFGMPNATEEDNTSTSWSHTGNASSTTNYYYVVRAVWDGIEERNQDKVGRYRMELHNGWNLVASPIQLGYGKVGIWAADMDADIPGSVEQVVRWTQTGWNSWLSVIPWVNNYTLDPSQCYFVYVSGGGGVWLPEGTLYSNNLELDLHYGWNPIAMPRHDPTTSMASHVTTQVNKTHGPGTAVAMANWTASGWETYIISPPADDFALNDAHHPNIANGYGWFLKCTQNVKWTPPPI